MFYPVRRKGCQMTIEICFLPIIDALLPNTKAQLTLTRPTPSALCSCVGFLIVEPSPPPSQFPPLSGSEPRQYWPNQTPPSMITISITIFIFIVIAINILFSDQHHDHHDSTPNGKYYENFPVFFNPSNLLGSDLPGLNLPHQPF